MVGIVQSHLFDFGDLIRLRDAELQALLGACDNANLARALFDSGEPIRDRILANVSDRRAALLEDETDLHAEATEDEIDLARREILARARVLYERGTITTYFGYSSLTLAPRSRAPRRVGVLFETGPTARCHGACALVYSEEWVPEPLI